MARSSGNERETVSEVTTSRLSVYLRCLNFLENEGVRTISSQELADRFQLNSAQIRKDLACFGEFGTRGVGYDVAGLKQHLVETLGLDRHRGVIIVGAGNLGMALADYDGFHNDGYRIVALLDSDPAKWGRESKRGVRVVPRAELESIVKREQVEIGIIAVPAEAAQAAYDAFADAGLHAVLNFAPAQLKLRPRIKVKSVDLRINLESLSFHLRNVEDGLV